MHRAIEVMELFGHPPPPGLEIHEDWLGRAEHDVLVEAIDALPFDTTLSRRTQHYGYYYNYSDHDVDVVDPAPKPPRSIALLGTRLHEEMVFHREPDQVIVNEYVGAQGISAHIDRKSFGPVVATVSLIESWPMVFRYLDRDEVELVLPVRSLVVMRGPSRSSWTHEIKKRRTDQVGGLRVRRSRRISVTFRTVTALDDASPSLVEQ
jgi:alkylated DNA repair dioxygenase AlkB